MNTLFTIRILFLLLGPVLLAQLVPSKTYYDFNKTILKEKFFVQKKNPTLLDSTYLLYYQHGQLKTKGNFKNNKAHGTWLYYYENGSPKMEGTFVNGEQSGYWIYYYENGHKSMEGSITKDIKQGTWIYYYENGNKKNYGPYINNKKDGVWLYFGEDGNTKAQAIYKNDQGTYTEMYSNGTVKSEGEIKDGKSNGIWRYYYEDGKLKAEGEEKDGVKNGYWKFYHRNDSLASEGYYKNGLAEGNWKYYYENGNVSSEGPQKDGQKNGYWKLFYPSGASKGSATFENGNGTYREYYESGKLKTEGAILQDKNEGLWNYYYESGAKEGQCFFNAGTGKYRGFYEDGGLKMEGLLRNGIKDSIWVLYKENGQVAGYYTTIYENDVPYFRNVDSTDAAPKVKRDTIQPKEKPGIRTVKRKSRYFSPKINEFKGLIASVGMIGLVKRTLSLNLEFYYQERQGIELNLSLIRSPFFGVEEFFPTNQLYRRGFSMSGKIKLYERDHDRGMFYFGHELRYTRIRWSNRIIDSTVGLVAFPISKIENTWEYFFNVGDRLMQDSKKPGFTLDLNAALGIGYRSVQPLKNYPESYERFFDEINKGQITRGTLSIRPRVEITVGYVFKNKNRRF